MILNIILGTILPVSWVLFAFTSSYIIPGTIAGIIIFILVIINLIIAYENTKKLIVR